MKSICGLGCQMHHLTYCLITAYASNRTLLVKPSKWKYTNDGYQVYFKEIANPKCLISDFNITDTWSMNF
jgi:hypothetical protein